VASRGIVLRNPTYNEALSFIAADKTDRNKYVSGKYTCVNFAADFKHNAMAKGYRCAFVILEFQGGLGHAVNAFYTVDAGLIYVEPQTDEVLNLEVGQTLYGYVIVRIIIVW
jgi:hypothetical protein